MVKFKEWLNNQNSFLQEIENILKSWKIQVLNTMQTENGRILLKFPKNIDYVSKSDSNTATVAEPQTIAAGMTYSGNDLNEAFDRSTRHDKGPAVLRSLNQIIDPTTGLGWSKQQQNKLRDVINYNFGKIAQPMGYLFETEVFLHLKYSHKLKDMDDGEMGVEERKNDLISKIAPHARTSLNQLLQLVEVHAMDLGDQIVKRTKRILGCADMVWFSAKQVSSSSSSWTGRGNPADIIVGCSVAMGDDRVGYSLKFGTETRISIASLSIPSAVHLLAGKTLPSQIKIINNIEQDKSWSARVAKIFHEMADGRFNGNPKNFVSLLNYLLSGKSFTFPAARNYASKELGGAEWSANFKKDFIVSDKPSNPLKAKPNADVTLDSNSTYLKMIYKVPDGTMYGTILFFIPRQGKIDVKINNLTSTMR